MATASMIGVADPDALGFQVRTCCYDGHPHHQVPALARALLLHDGEIPTLAATLLRHDWLYLAPDEATERARTMTSPPAPPQPPTAVTTENGATVWTIPTGDEPPVAGIGFRLHDTYPATAPHLNRLDYPVHLGDAEWLYVLTPRTVQVLHAPLLRWETVAEVTIADGVCPDLKRLRLFE